MRQLGRFLRACASALMSTVAAIALALSLLLGLAAFALSMQARAVAAPRAQHAPPPRRSAPRGGNARGADILPFQRKERLP